MFPRVFKEIERDKQGNMTGMSVSIIYSNRSERIHCRVVDFLKEKYPNQPDKWLSCGMYTRSGKDEWGNQYDPFNEIEMDKGGGLREVHYPTAVKFDVLDCKCTPATGENVSWLKEHGIETVEKCECEIKEPGIGKRKIQISRLLVEMIKGGS